MNKILVSLMSLIILFSHSVTIKAMESDMLPEWSYGYPKKVLDAYFYEENFSKELSDQMSKESDLIFNNLSDEEKDAIRNYTGVNNISAFLTVPNFNYKYSSFVDIPKLEKYVKLISNLINKSHLKEDVTLFQGNSLDCLSKVLSKYEMESISNTADEESVNDIINSLKGKVFSTSDFSSTSTSCGVAACRFTKWGETNVFISINAKKGLSYLPIMQHSVCPTEEEVLLSRNLKFRITDAIFKITSGLVNGKSCIFLECETIN